MQKVQFETFCDSICVFDLQYNIVSDICISFFVSSPIRIKLTFLLICAFLFIVAMEISISLKTISYQSNLRPVSGENFTSIRAWEDC